MQTEKSRNIKQFRIRNFQRYIYVFSLYLSKEKANWYHIEIYLRKGSKTNQKTPKDRHLYKLMLFIVKFHFSAHCTVYNGGVFLKKNPPKANIFKKSHRNVSFWWHGLILQDFLVKFHFSAYCIIAAYF